MTILNNIGSIADDTVKIWHVKTGKLLHSLEGGSCGKGVLSVSFSQDGKFLVAGLEGGEIIIWQAPETNP